MIIIEGMDNTGKTTLCEQLESSMIPAHKRFKLSEVSNPTREDKLRLAKEMESPDFFKRDLIMDRNPLISELVYGPILRGDSVYGLPKNWEMLVRYIMRNPTYVIYCRPPTERILHSMGNQMDGVSDKAELLLNRYDEVMAIVKNLIINSTSKGLFFEYDWSNIKSRESLQIFINLYLKWEK